MATNHSGPEKVTVEAESLDLADKLNPHYKQMMRATKQTGYPSVLMTIGDSPLGGAEMVSARYVLLDKEDIDKLTSFLAGSDSKSALRPSEGGMGIEARMEEIENHQGLYVEWYALIRKHMGQAVAEAVAAERKQGADECAIIMLDQHKRHATELAQERTNWQERIVEAVAGEREAIRQMAYDHSIAIRELNKTAYGAMQSLITDIRERAAKPQEDGPAIRGSFSFTEYVG